MSMAKSSAAPAQQLSGQDWLNRINGPHTKLRYIRCDEGLWEVTTPEFGEMLEIYAKENAELSKPAHQALYEALSAAVAVIKTWHGEPAWEIYFKNAPEMKPIRAALALADAAQEGEANG